MTRTDVHHEEHVPSRVLLASSSWWPLSAKLAIAFLRNGCVVDVVCAHDHPFLFINGIRKIYRYRGLRSVQSLYEAIVASGPDVVVPCDDSVVWQLHELHRTRAELRGLIERSLGDPSGYGIVAGRAELLEVAEELSIRTPRMKRVASVSDLREWFSGRDPSAVLKADRTCAGKSVRIVHSLAEAEQAMGDLSQTNSIATALGRWLVIHDVSALWNWRRHGRLALSLQKLIRGVPANTMMACRDGKVLGLVTVEVLCAQGETGASLVVRLTENDEIRVAAEKIAKRLRLSGFHGLDFVLEEGTGDAYLIELNPRCTQLGHLQIAGQGDLAGMLSGTSADAFFRRRQPIREQIVAFFPQVVLAEKKCPYVESAYVDVPWDEPRLVQEMARRDWRDRSLLARAYHAIWPPNRPVKVFEAAPVGDEQRPAKSVATARG
jgi:hypothetical protein